MIELTELSLHNFKNHRKKTLQFASGITGIVGDNGKGKSSIIAAISFLFTGEVDTDTKRDCITVGETEGWVKGSFRLNGKDGSLERHLSSSKVILIYDGETYNKVSEVNALWSDMLKIDSAIFNNVIIARQGEIQKLFSDETAVREKIFQKIFLVPATEKLRGFIWDNYIKTCPPEKPAEDVVSLQAAQAGVATNRNKGIAEIERLSMHLADPVFIQSVNERIQYLDKCRKDDVKRPQLNGELIATEQELAVVDLEIAAKTKKLSSVDVPKLRAEYDRLLTNKTAYGRFNSITNELNNLLQTAMPDDEYLSMQTKLKELQGQAEVIQTQNIEDTAKLRELAGKINKFSQLTGHANCPTCNQILPDIVAFLQELRKEEGEVKTRNLQNNTKAATIGRSIQSWNQAISTADTQYNRIKYLTGELNAMGDIDYSEERFNALRVELQEIEKLQNGLNPARVKRNGLIGQQNLLKERLNNLATYNGNSTIDGELSIMQTALAEEQRTQQQITQLELEAAKLQHELELYNRRIQTSQQNAEYNARRKQFVERLTQAYDLFHVSCFPRKLIESYMDQVQSALSGYLEHFELPYSVQIADGFKIRLVNQEGHVLPTVSGGQEVMIGICLRLALHKMFAKSFPIWIVDEGTTHLSETKKPQYFSLIDELRNQKIINQIIVIDHDERLASVVDSTIQL